uniref:Uncharacterized protein n=1 Tax=Timema genevievae TaxID=629358 RepID=A0A7R9K2R1_TIMGE|nr:unnamed protein product [Timema genevievae]
MFCSTVPLTAPKAPGPALPCRMFNLSLVFSNKPHATPAPQLPLPSAIRPTRQDEKPNLKRKIMDAIEGACKKITFSGPPVVNKTSDYDAKGSGFVSQYRQKYSILAQKCTRICMEGEWETIRGDTLSTPDRDSHLYLPVIGILVYSESDALDHAATEVTGWMDNSVKVYQENETHQEVFQEETVYDMHNYPIYWVTTELAQPIKLDCGTNSVDE